MLDEHRILSRQSDKVVPNQAIAVVPNQTIVLKCVAVGGSYGGFVPGAGTPAKKIKPLAELWNGQSWKELQIPTPPGSPSSLNSVSCGSPTSCTAVGEVSGSPATLFAEHWNGHRWARQMIATPAQIPDPGFVAVSCATSRTCTAVGGRLQANPFIAQAVGDHWTLRTPARPGNARRPPTQ